MLAVEFQNPALSHLILGQTFMALTLELETLFLEALNTSYIYPITSKVGFVKRLANYINYWHMFLTSNHICPNRSKHKTWPKSTRTCRLGKITIWTSIKEHGSKLKTC